MVPIYVETKGRKLTAEEKVPLSSPLVRQSKMHMKEGNLVMADFLVVEVFLLQQLH